MDQTQIVPVVLSGGSGTRLWPASRPNTPKQLLPLVDDRTMLHATLDRVQDLAARRPAIVVCNAAQQELVQLELQTAGDTDGQVIVEPMGRNTAPAVAVAAIAAASHGDDPVLLVMPADHVIRDVAGFQTAIAAGAAAAQDGHLVTFGIVPDHPATGYGYIKAGTSDGVPQGMNRIDEFVEKPNRETAERFLATHQYLWNSGMFMFLASTYLAELERFEGKMAAACRNAMAAATQSDHVVALDADSFAESPSNSIDYAVMEHTDSGIVIPLDVGWSDVGSWASLHDIAETNKEGNAIIGDVLTQGVAGSYLRSEGPLLAVVGLSNIVAVSTPDAVLVADMDRSEDVKAIVARLKQDSRSESETSVRTESRWGTTVRLLAAGNRIVEQLTIHAGASVEIAAESVCNLVGQVNIGDAPLAPGASITLATATMATNSGTEAAQLLTVSENG